MPRAADAAWRQPAVIPDLLLGNVEEDLRLGRLTGVRFFSGSHLKDGTARIPARHSVTARVVRLPPTLSCKRRTRAPLRLCRGQRMQPGASRPSCSGVSLGCAFFLNSSRCAKPLRALPRLGCPCAVCAFCASDQVILSSNFVTLSACCTCHRFHAGSVHRFQSQTVLPTCWAGSGEAVVKHQRSGPCAFRDCLTKVLVSVG